MMNVTSASNTSASSVGSSTTQNNTASNVETDKSFDEEIKNASTQENQENENVSEPTEEKQTENQKQSAQNNDTDVIISHEQLSGGINFTDFKYGNENQIILSQNIQNLINTKDMISAVNSANLFEDYDLMNMSFDDAKFFVDLTQNTNMSMQSIADFIENNFQNDMKNIQQNIKVSATLMNKLTESMKNNQSFRIDFDKDISVIIKVNRDGSLMANFIPGDKAVEQYLKNNIASLRQRFDDENLSYSELSYSNSGNKEQRNRKKEKNNE